MHGKTLMVMGASSSVGKSLVVAAICRCLARMGLRVAPFKAQNLSNNAAVCADGSEIGRSQAMQAAAARVAPHSDINPVLLKPEGSGRSQVVVNGRVDHSLQNTDATTRRQQLWPQITAALDRLRSQYDVVVIEGAGSPAELNLTSIEMTNMSVARHCQAPVLLVGDIQRGGVFAQLLGTLMLLPDEDRRLIQGMIVNKFHGDASLFASGARILAERGGVPVLGILPWIEDHGLPEEDAEPLYDKASHLTTKPVQGEDALDIAVIQFPHIANFDEFAPLASHPHVSLRYVSCLQQLGAPQVIILPGTKNTMDDLQWLRDTGLSQRIQDAAETEGGATIVGICGGYQMLGKRIQNPQQVESQVTSCEGLGLLDIHTTLSRQKQTAQARFRIANDCIAPGCHDELLHGYEIHCGESTTTTPWMKDVGSGREEGAVAAGGRVWGCYLHGLFGNAAFCNAWLKQLGLNAPVQLAPVTLDDAIDRVADVFAAHVDINQLLEITSLPRQTAR